MTCNELLDALAAAGVRVIAGTDGLAIEGNVPAELASPLLALQTGVRALATGKDWLGLPSGEKLFYTIDPLRPVPAGIDWLAVRGDVSCDRLNPHTRANHPELFEQVVAGGAAA